MFRILGALFALALVLGLAFAYDGFDVETGRSDTIGVGAVMPPGQGVAPASLTATRIVTSRTEWDCELTNWVPGSSFAQFTPQWAVYTQPQTSVAPARTHVRHEERVLNYTFTGWQPFSGALQTILESSRTMPFVPYCGSANRVPVNIVRPWQVFGTDVVFTPAPFGQ